MLGGSFTVKVDEKGRFKVPADFKRLILDKFGEGPFFITSIRGECAQIYPGRAWEEVNRKLDTQPPSNPTVKKFRRATSFYGQSVSMDPQGRILIHPLLRTEAGLTDEVVVIGQNNHLEVWSLKRFKKALLASPFSSEDEDYLAKLGI